MISIEKKFVVFLERQVYKKKMWSEKKDHERKKYIWEYFSLGINF